MAASPDRRARRAAERGDVPTPLPPREPNDRYSTGSRTASENAGRSAILAAGVDAPIIRSLSDVISLPVGSSVTAGATGSIAAHYKVASNAWTGRGPDLLTDEEVAARGIRRVSLGNIFHRSSTDEGRVSA